MTNPLTVRVVYESERKTTYAVTGDGGKSVSVRNSVASSDAFTCLTCITNDCAHANAARDYEASRKAQGDGD